MQEGTDYFEQKFHLAKTKLTNKYKYLITIYTDGASRGNPGPGAYAAILTHQGHRKELVQAFRKTTNNRMELWAVIIGLEALRKAQESVVLYTDSRYVTDAIEKGWLQAWLRCHFKNKKNADLWQRFWKVYQQHQVTFQWIKGHAGHDLNEQCDQLATRCIRTGPWHIDTAYETLSQPNILNK